MRGADIPAGSGRHHVNRLVRAGLLVEKRHGSKAFLFENRAQVRSGWQDLAILRDPNAKLLHDWLERNPDRSQQEIIAAFQAAHGWTRRATQGRLERLVRDGASKATKRGRYKHYTASKASLNAEPLMAAHGHFATIPATVQARA